MLPPIGQLNALDEEQAVAALEPLFEGAPRFVRRLVAGRPHDSYEALLNDAQQVALAMPDDEQVELLDAHPRIGAPPASVSATSHSEQGYDHDRGSAELQAELDRLNAEYEARFGFRFVIHVAGRPRSAIVPIISRSLHAEREAEKARAVQDVIAIARDRAARLAVEEGR